MGKRPCSRACWVLSRLLRVKSSVGSIWSWVISSKRQLVEAVWDAFPSLNQAEVRAALARCGLTSKHIESQIQVLSGGEQAKVRLCLLMNRENNVLVLDEPTNHLDVDAKDELKRALQAYKGSILMVCHEPDFYEGWVDHIWDFNQLT